MIEPIEFSPYNLVECLNSGLREKLFISFSSKSLVIGLNKLQCCKIRLDGKYYTEIENIKKQFASTL